MPPLVDAAKYSQQIGGGAHLVLLQLTKLAVPNISAKLVKVSEMTAVDGCCVLGCTAEQFLTEDQNISC